MTAEVIAPRDVYLPAVGRDVAKGETVTVSDADGRSLTAQGWKTPARKAPAKKAAPAAAEPTVPGDPAESQED